MGTTVPYAWKKIGYIDKKAETSSKKIIFVQSAEKIRFLIEKEYVPNVGQNGCLGKAIDGRSERTL